MFNCVYGPWKKIDSSTILEPLYCPARPSLTSVLPSGTRKGNRRWIFGVKVRLKLGWTQRQKEHKKTDRFIYLSIHFALFFLIFLTNRLYVYGIVVCPLASEWFSGSSCFDSVSLCFLPFLRYSRICSLSRYQRSAWKKANETRGRRYRYAREMKEEKKKEHEKALGRGLPLQFCRGLHRFAILRGRVNARGLAYRE